MLPLQPLVVEQRQLKPKLLKLKLKRLKPKLIQAASQTQWHQQQLLPQNLLGVALCQEQQQSPPSQKGLPQWMRLKRQIQQNPKLT
jgi:hypothetical protein